MINEKPASPTTTAKGVTPEMVEAATRAYFGDEHTWHVGMSNDILENVQNSMRAALQAAFALSLPASHTQGELKVRELEWTRKGNKWSCQTAIGLYVMTASPAGGTYSVLLHGSVDFGAPKFTSLYHAIAHSQADFESRILSALDRTTLPPVEGMVNIVQCTCHDDNSRRLCMKKDRCSVTEAHSAPQGTRS